VVAHAWHGDLHELRCESGQFEPPGCGKPTRDGSVTVTPHCGSDPGGIGERSIVDEEDASRAAPPMTRPDEPLNREPTQAAFFGLTERDDSIMVTQKVVEHISTDA
jgi:hypothetical protein